MTLVPENGLVTEPNPTLAKNLVKEFKIAPQQPESKSISGGTWNRDKKEYRMKDEQTGVETVYTLAGSEKGLPKFLRAGDRRNVFVSERNFKDGKQVVRDEKTQQWREVRTIDKVKTMINRLFTVGYVQNDVVPGNDGTYSLHLEKYKSPFASKPKIVLG